MSLRERARATCGALSAVLVLLTLPAAVAPSASAGPTQSATARTSVSEVVNLRFGDGDPAGLGYKVTHEVLAPMQPGTAFPSARIDATEHPEAFEGQWADSGYHAAWISPPGEFQYTPDAYTVESGYFDNAIAEDGAALAPGDSVDFAVKQLAGDAPLTWDKQRSASADGEMQWDVATRHQIVEATYGGAEKSMEVVFVRADLVARGGDFDARDAAAQLPPLVIDLPRTYGPGTRASAAVSQFSPYLHYLNNVEGQVLPQSGRAVITARTRGYLPEARDVTLPGGTHVREWHIPLNLVIALFDTSGGLDPFGQQSAIHMPTGGVVWTFDDTGKERIEVPRNGTVLTGDGMLPQSTTSEGEPAPQDEGAAPQLGPSAGTLMDDIEAASAVDRTLDSPMTLRLAKRNYEMTIDPDLNGDGVLGIRSARHLRTGQAFYETAAVPYVYVDGELVTLDRSRLVDLRAVPLTPYISIGFSSRADGGALDPTSYVTSRWGHIQRPSAVIDAVYDLGNDRYAFFNAFAMLQAGSIGDAIDTSLVVRSFSGQPAEVSAVHYMELSEPGPITYDGRVMTTEFTGPSKALTTPTATIFGGATGGSQMTVVRAGPGIASQPTADPAASIEGQPIAVYITPSEVSSTDLYASILGSWLNDVTSRESIEPAPIDEPCIEPQVIDDRTSDVAAGLDVTRTWFDFDGVNLYSTIELARLDQNVVGSPATFRSSWRYEHIGYGLQAARDVTGAWTYRIGLHSSAGTPWNPINSVPVTGELQFGSPGYIRMSSPIDIPLTGIGFLDGETLRDTGATSFDANGVQDRAPEGATDSAYGRGADFLVATCPSLTLPTILELAPLSETSGQYSDRATLTARLTDASGAAVEGAAIEFSFGTQRPQAITDASGLATVTVDLDMAPGVHPIGLSYGGSDRYEASVGTGEFRIDLEDSKLVLAVTGNGSKRTINATLTELDSSAAIGGRTVHFYRDGSLIGSATTNSQGVATLEAPPGSRGTRQSFSAQFRGDGFFLPSGG